MLDRRQFRLLNIFLRIVTGLGFLAWSTSRLSHKPRKKSSLFLAIIGMLTVGEGIFHFLLFTDLTRGLENLHEEPQLKKIIDIIIPEDKKQSQEIEGKTK